MERQENLRTLMKVNEYYSCFTFPEENTCSLCSLLMEVCLGEVSTFDSIHISVSELILYNVCYFTLYQE